MGGRICKYSSSLLLALPLAGAFVETPVRAQAMEAPSGAVDVADALILPSVSITATKNPIEAFEYPGMVSVIDRRSGEGTLASSPDDMMRYLPGVDFSGGPRPPALSGLKSRAGGVVTGSYMRIPHENLRKCCYTMQF